MEGYAPPPPAQHRRRTRQRIALAAAAVTIAASFGLAIAFSVDVPNTSHAVTTCETIDGGLEPGENCWTPNPDQTIPAQPTSGCWLVDPAEPQWGENCAGTTPQSGLSK